MIIKDKYMADFTIPKGKDYKFTVNVLTKDSFLPQDLTDVDTITFELIAIEGSCAYKAVVSGAVIGNPIDGVVGFTLDSTYTADLVVERGDKVDGYYLKPTYQGIVTVTFTTGISANRIAILDKVYVMPTGC